MYAFHVNVKASVRTGRQASPVVGENIRSLRQLQKMSQAELASMVAGLDQSAIARIEQGKRVVSIEEAQEISSALGATVLDLLNGVGDQGDRLFASRVVRPMRELEACLAEPEHLMDALGDGSISAIVNRLREGVAAYSEFALDPSELMASGERVSEILTFAGGLVNRYEAFVSELRTAVERFTSTEDIEQVQSRAVRRAEATKVKRRE